MEIFLPHNMSNNKASIDEFLDFQRRFTEIAEKMRGYDLEKNKLDSMVYSFINLRLGDALTIINQHTARHLNQAYNVLKSPEFPTV